jgi:hypothetical protein
VGGLRGVQGCASASGGLRGCKPRGDALPHPPACGSASRAGPRQHIRQLADLRVVWGQDAASAGVQAVSREGPSTYVWCRVGSVHEEVERPVVPEALIATGVCMSNHRVPAST